MGLGQKFLTRVGPGQFFVAQVESGQVSHLWFKFGFGKFPLKIPKFSFGLSQKVPWSKMGRRLFLLRVKNMLGSGQGPSLPWLKVSGWFFCNLGLRTAGMARQWIHNPRFWFSARCLMTSQPWRPRGTGCKV